MRKDLRPWWVKRCYLRFRHWYTEYYLRPACDFLGPYHTVMKPWYVNISGNNIYIGKCFTAIGEQMHQVEIGVWGRAVVTRDVPANVVVAGNPARVVKELDPER